MCIRDRAMAILKYVIFQKKAQPFYKQSGLNWTEAIAVENKRQQSILKFFSQMCIRDRS